MFERFVGTPTGEALRNTYGQLVVRAMVDGQTPPSPDPFLESNAEIAATLSPRDLQQTRRSLRAILLASAGMPHTQAGRRTSPHTHGAV